MGTSEAELVDRVDDRLQDGNERLCERLQALVERIVEEVVVNIPREVNEALLLRARDRVVSRVEVRNQHASESVEQFQQDGPLPGWGVGVDDFFHVGEGPDVAGVSLDYSLGLV